MSRDDLGERFERQLVRHCSPTLAGLKSGNIFNLFIDLGQRRSLDQSISAWNARLNGKGIYLTVLKSDGARALVYVYRRGMLAEDLGSEAAARFLSPYGYRSPDPDASIERLKERIDSASPFPHEIGLFLGYPLHDVVGFIENGGQAPILSGCWKVYSNADQARERFEMFRKCSGEYLNVFNSGTSADQLAVGP